MLSSAGPLPTERIILASKRPVLLVDQPQLDREGSGHIVQMMPDDSANKALERVLAAVGQCLDRKSAESLLRLRADAEMQARIEELADNTAEPTTVKTLLWPVTTATRTKGLI